MWADRLNDEPMWGTGRVTGEHHSYEKHHTAHLQVAKLAMPKLEPGVRTWGRARGKHDRSPMIIEAQFLKL
jgi:hypothetical protein